MLVDILIPEVGEGVTEATIVRWHKEPGDAVATGELVLEIMTDKVTVEIESPGAGTLADIVHQADDEVKIGTVVGRIRAAAR